MVSSVLSESGTTLFHISAKYLNDATEWYRIAKINNLNDPFLPNMTTLIIPNARGNPVSRSGESAQ
jgi:hypothetical protein